MAGRRGKEGKTEESKKKVKKWGGKGSLAEEERGSEKGRKGVDDGASATAKEGKKKEKALKQIIRIAGKDLNGDLPMRRALVGIRGVGHAMANAISARIAIELRMNRDMKLGDLDGGQIELVEDIIAHPEKHNVPVWMYNRKNDIETGRSSHLTGPDLELKHREDVGRKRKTKSYQGVRHSLGLTVRGQRTRTSGRKGTTMGVIKRKDVKGSGK